MRAYGAEELAVWFKIVHVEFEVECVCCVEDLDSLDVDLTARSQERDFALRLQVHIVHGLIKTIEVHISSLTINPEKTNKVISQNFSIDHIT